MTIPDEAISYRGRKNWRKWLGAHHTSRRQIWVIFRKRKAGRPAYRIYYNEAVEEAICFDWIDSRIRSINSERCAVRFTPRTSDRWSKYNVARAIKMIEARRMTPTGMATIPGRIRRLTRASSGRARGAHRNGLAGHLT